MIARFCKWYLKHRTSYLWEVYNEGYRDGIEYAVLSWEEE